MAKKAIIVNTHPGDNPTFTSNLLHFMDELGIESEIIPGYEGENPLTYNPHFIFLTGVPISASYSLAEMDTQKIIEKEFSWLRECVRPVMGICFGHQILAHIFGGEVSKLVKMVEHKRFPLHLDQNMDAGLFSGIEHLEVFTEHKDYISVVPDGFKVLCRENDIPYIIYHAQKEMYGVQFVPELSGQVARQILKLFVDT